MTQEFYEITKDRPPSPLLIRAIEHVANKNRALDLGCGAGKDSKYLVQQGFEVTAVDANSETENLIRQLPNQDRLHYFNSTFDNFPFEEGGYDLVNAQWSLPFSSKDTFDNMFSKMKAAIKPGGIFSGQLFGVNDQWNKDGRDMTFHTREEVQKLFEQMEIIEFREEDRDGILANGTPKHWHVFHIIARKR